MQSCLRRIDAAAARRVPFLISTPNLNFLVNSLSDFDFREALLLSDLCPADGMPIVWIARLLGIPIKERVAGSDIFDALKTEHNAAKPLRVFFFGGDPGVAATAAQALNAEPSGLYCVGSLCPDFGSVDSMSQGDIIDKINSSGADFLAVSLGAKKGQSWLQHNYNRLLIPVRTHLGAVINFQAGIVRRAPPIMRKYGLEWIWRIKEEPYLWKRYWNDGKLMLQLLFTRVLPIVMRRWWLTVRYGRHAQDLIITQTDGCKTVTVGLAGSATVRHVKKVIHALRNALATKKQILIDFSNTRDVDSRILGLFLMLRKQLKERGASPMFVGLSPKLEKMFRLNGLGFLLSNDKGEE
jgi:N-acetylglucosaminyldiphosphoundecaprenol N-acetyl-beta-D-mannosaminyltransferase